MGEKFKSALYQHIGVKIGSSERDKEIAMQNNFPNSGWVSKRDFSKPFLPLVGDWQTYTTSLYFD